MNEKKYVIYDVLNSSIVSGFFKNERDAENMAYHLRLNNTNACYHVMPVSAPKKCYV